MYKLIYKNQFAAGFDADQIVGNLAQLLQLKPKTVRLVFLAERPSVIKILETTAEVEQWCAAFLEAGVHLDVVSMAAPDADSLADQIELELELHSLDDDLDDDDEPPRQLLVKKIIVRDEPSIATDSVAADIVEQAKPQQEKPQQDQPVITPPVVVQPAVLQPIIESATIAPTAEASEPAEQQPVAQQVIAPADGTVLKSKEITSAESVDSTAPVKIETPASIAVQPEPESNSTASVEDETKPEAATNAEPGASSVLAFKSDPVAKLDDDTKPSSAVQPETEPAENDKENDVAPSDDYVDVDWHKSSFLWGMLAIVFAIALTASTILWLKRPLWLPATESAQAENIVNALATNTLFALAHIDVQRAQQLPDVLQPGSGLQQLPAPEKDFWQKLEQSGIDIAQQLDDVWISVYRANDQTQPLWVLTGQFNPGDIRAWLKKNYVIDDESPQQIVFSSVDDNTCEKSPVSMAVIESNRIVLGAPERVAAFRGRLDAAAPPEKDLADWELFSKKQMVTLALFNPAQFSETTTATALGKLSVDAAQVKGIYFGVAPRLMPPVLEFTAAMVGTNTEFINTAEQNIAPLLADVKNTVAQDWPETLAIYERLKLNKTEQQLRASVLFDEQIQPQLQLWVNSLLTPTLATNVGNTPVAEMRLDEKPRVFTGLPSPQLADFASVKHLNSSVAAQTSTGPFGVGISSIEATADGDLITVEVNAFNLPNLGKEAGSVQLRILDIVDHQDQSLLTATGCDAAGVRSVTKVDMIYEGTFLDQGQPVPYIGIQGTKKILLPKTINLSTVGAIKGELSYKLPLDIERFKIDGPLAGKTIDTHGLQLRFLSAAENRLQFQHAGNSDALLQVNALNAEGKVLAIMNKVSSANSFAAGATTSIDVHGTIAAVEVIVASKLEAQTYPFSFGRIQPPEQTFATTKPAPELLTTTALAALKQEAPPVDVQYPYQAPQQTIIAGPALIAVNQMSIQAQQLSLMADIYLRNQHPLTRQLSAVRFFITEVEDSAGNIHPVNFQSPVALAHQGGGWVDGAYQLDATQPWLRGQLDLRAQDLGVSDVVAFWGKLVFLAATDPIAIPLPFQFGMQWNGADSSFKLARWEAGRLLFDIQGSFPELMAITALDDNGAVISQAAELRTSLGVNQVELPILRRPVTVEFSIARNQQTAEFPFEIRAQ